MRISRGPPKYLRDSAQRHLTRRGRRHNRHGDRVAYVHNPAADPARFADGTFDLVLSFITLQQVAPADARRYIAEFVRGCAPGGAASTPSSPCIP